MSLIATVIASATIWVAGPVDAAAVVPGGGQWNPPGSCEAYGGKWGNPGVIQLGDVPVFPSQTSRYDGQMYWPVGVEDGGGDATDGAIWFDGHKFSNRSGTDVIASVSC